MFAILALSTVPAVLAAGFDSVGLALVATAGVIWALGVYTCTAAPVVPARTGAALNDRVAALLSIVAGVVATIGAIVTVL